jgi:putative flavoprotein involved in K+ transport
MARDEVVNFFESYAWSFDAPVHEGVNVLAIDRTDGGRYSIRTDHGVWQAVNVAIATGMFQHPSVPAWSQEIPPAVFQQHSSHYSKPGALPPGAVLVIGSGASGFQIAEELNHHGRQVFFSVGRHERPPRRYRGRDTMWWLEQIGVFDQVTATPTDRWQQPVASPPAMVPPSPALTGVRGGHDLDPHQLAAHGVVLLGRVAGMDAGVLSIAPDLLESLSAGDAGFHAWRERMQTYIQTYQISAPEEPPVSVYPVSAAEASPLDRLDLGANRITSVVWATGFHTDFRWIHAPVFDDKGHPLHYRGVTRVPGLYFLRIAPFYKRRATLIDGLEEDAGYVAESILAEAAISLAAD